MKVNAGNKDICYDVTYRFRITDILMMGNEGETNGIHSGIKEIYVH